MNVLAIDFSSKIASVAVLSEGAVLASMTSETLRLSGSESAPASGNLLKQVGVSSMLTPLVQATIEQSGLKVADFRLIALPVGPGLFTGLRVGVVTAKSFAYATQADVIGVNTLEVLAAKAHAANGSHEGPIRVAINAQRQQLFVGQYQFVKAWRVEQIGDNLVVDQQAWLESWADGDLISGSGLKLVRSGIEATERLVQGFQIADEATWECDAVSVGKVAIEHFNNGRRDDPWKLKPLYFRPSAAEEVRMARLKSNE